MAAIQTGAQPRPRAGRPRSIEADRAIHSAAIELLGERGYDGVTIEEVAARAGVAKSTVYRRYPCKTDLLIASVEQLAEHEVPVGDTGRIEDDLFEMACNMRRLMADTELGRAVPAALAAVARDPVLAAAHRQLVTRRRKDALDLVRRAVERGQLPAGTDVDTLVDMVVSPIFYRVFVARQRVDDEFLRAVVRTVLAGSR